MKTRIELFMAKVDKTESCWNWKGSMSGSGYGQFWDGDRLIQAHHFLLADLVPKGLQACHKCDNRRCVNPEHIFIGTRSDNMRDCVQKNRHNREAKSQSCKAMLKVRKLRVGSQNSQSKLTEAQVSEILSTPRGYGSGVALSRKFGVTETVISGIRRGKRWQAFVKVMEGEV